MADLTIPPEAYDAAESAVTDMQSHPGGPLTARHFAEAAVRAAAPLIVAAELERLADEWHTVAKSVALTDPAKGLTCQGFASRLRSRARELRGKS